MYKVSFNIYLYIYVHLLIRTNRTDIFVLFCYVPQCNLMLINVISRQTIFRQSVL